MSDKLLIQETLQYQYNKKRKKENKKPTLRLLRIQKIPQMTTKEEKIQSPTNSNFKIFQIW